MKIINNKLHTNIEITSYHSKWNVGHAFWEGLFVKFN